MSFVDETLRLDHWNENFWAVLLFQIPLPQFKFHSCYRCVVEFYTRFLWRPCKSDTISCINKDWWWWLSLFTDNKKYALLNVPANCKKNAVNWSINSNVSVMLSLSAKIDWNMFSKQLVVTILWKKLTLLISVYISARERYKETKWINY